MTTDQEIQKIEVTIEECKKTIERRDALVRLQKNRDFISLIEDGFLREHAIRQVELKSHPGAQNEKQQQSIDNQIIAIGSFKQYLNSIRGMGEQAEQALSGDEETLEELNAEAVTQ